MEITPQTPIADLVRQVPAAIAVLQRHGVAFCCTGKTPLSEACAHHGIAPEQLLADIEESSVPHPNDLTLELPRISAMLDKLVRRHGDRLPDVLPPLQATFEQFRDDLMKPEPRAIEVALVRMRDLTNSYTPPDDACPTFRGVYYALSELERDMERVLTT